MKRTLSVLVAALLVVAVAGQAAAFFEDGSFIQVIYKSDDKEVATSLFDLGAVNLTQNNVQIAPAGSFKLNDFTTLGPTYEGSDWASLRSAFFGVDFDSGDIFLATTKPSAPVVKSSGVGGFYGAYDVTRAYYEGLAGGQTRYGNPSAPNSYWAKFDSSQPGVAGQYGGFLDETSMVDGEAVLTALGTIGYVDMYLYHFAGASLIQGQSNPYTAVMRLFADGSTVMNPVPVPAALWLLGTGLVGLVGIRRRKSN